MSDVSFYLIGTVLKKQLYTGIVYEEIKDYGSEEYFSTISKKGNFISRVLIASYSQHGTYLDNEGARHAYYKEINGCLYKDLTIVRFDDIGVDGNYNIHPDGTIVEYKRDRFDSLLRVDPNNAETHLNYARYFEGQEDHVNAKNQFELATKLKPRSAAIYNEYAHYLGNGSIDTINAKRYYEKAIAMAPDSADYYWSYAFFLTHDANDKENARIQYEKGIAHAPNNASLHWYYAHFLLDELHLTKEGRQHYLKAVKLDPKTKNKEDDHTFHVK